jgi:hypothetical protein
MFALHLVGAILTGVTRVHFDWDIASHLMMMGEQVHHAQVRNENF